MSKHSARPWNKVILSIVTVAVLLASLAQPQYVVSAAADLTVSPITWDVVGLDSNNVNVGPNQFPVGVRVCNATGADPATNVEAAFTWTSSANDTYIYSRPGSYTTIPGPTEPAITINGGACRDFYFEVEIARDAASRGKARPYEISVTADGGISLTYPPSGTRQI